MFPQCYAAVVDRIKSMPEKVVVVDIGSWTIDIMYKRQDQNTHFCANNNVQI